MGSRKERVMERYRGDGAVARKDRERAKGGRRNKNKKHGRKD